jgi:hypothetical protein
LGYIHFISHVEAQKKQKETNERNKPRQFRSVCDYQFIFFAQAIACRSVDFSDGIQFLLISKIVYVVQIASFWYTDDALFLLRMQDKNIMQSISVFDTVLC